MEFIRHALTENENPDSGKFDCDECGHRPQIGEDMWSDEENILCAACYHKISK